MNFAILVENIRVEQWIADIVDQFVGHSQNNIAFFIIVDKSNKMFEANKFNGANNSLLISRLYSLEKINIDVNERQFLKVANESEIGYVTSQLREKQVDCLFNLTSVSSGEILRIFQEVKNLEVWEFELLNDLLLRNFSSTYYQRIDKHAIVLDLVSFKASGKSVIFSAKIRNIHYIIKRNVIQIIKLSKLITKKIVNRNYLHEFPQTILSKNNGYKVGPFDSVRLILRTFYDFCINLYKSLVFADNWQIWVVRSSVNDVMEGKFNPELQFKINSENSNTYYADPFLYLKNGNVGVFLEEYIYGNSTGYLRYYDAKQKRITPVTVKDYNMNYHVSYPFLLEYNEITYCIPETGDAKEVVIYRVTDDPSVLTREKVILTGISLVDVSIIKYNNKFWLFGCENETRGLSNTCLKIYYADDLFSEWKEHPLNPVKIDVTSSRPAGKLFIHDGKLFRPAQDCSRAYGDRIIINQIIKLNETEFSEEPIRIIEGNELTPNAIGTHTINFDDSFCTVDLKFRRKNSISSLLTKIRSHLK